ncbi:hypothetical protein KKF61_01125 [Patescibacteria group bacterium]|nr:hypothetical protein [Patescibacteria group bacterium]MBU0964100.1 hypothetical protein [Patescibacteria group bacterium]
MAREIYTPSEQSTIPASEQENGKEAPEPEITMVEHPKTHEHFKREVRFNEEGKPKKVFFFNSQNQITFYEDVEKMREINWYQMLLNAGKTQQHDKQTGVGPMNL